MIDTLELCIEHQKASKIHIGSGVFESLDTFLKTKHYSKLVVFTDQNTTEMCLPLIDQYYSFLNNAEIIELQDGEQSKSFSALQSIIEALIEYNIDRNALFIALGGGMIHDITGFIASIYKRGVDFISIPTSLLCMIDACLGGKTGINFKHVKNQIGSFYFAKHIYIYPAFTNSLPKQVYTSAMGEVLKYGLIDNASFFHKISAQKTVDQEDILKCLNIKMAFVKADPFDTGQRKKLNFGHTIGHALETSWTGKTPLLHGYAVGIGLLCEAYISKKRTGLSETEFKQIEKGVTSLLPPIKLNFNQDNFITAIKQDKKNSHHRIQIILLERIGNAIVYDNLSLDDLIESLDYYQSIT